MSRLRCTATLTFYDSLKVHFGQVQTLGRAVVYKTNRRWWLFMMEDQGSSHRVSGAPRISSPCPAAHLQPLMNAFLPTPA